ALVGDLRDVHQTVLARQDLYEGAEVHQPYYLALVDAADLDVRGNQLDPALRLAAGRTDDGCDLDGAVVLDVDRGAGLLGDRANHGATLADHLADLLRVDLHRNDGGGPLGHRLAGFRQHLGHFTQDVQARLPRLVECDLHDLLGDALDLYVHLQGGHAIGGARYLEVHVAEVILVAENVGQDLVAVAFEHEAHRDSSDRCLDRHPCVHEREARAADA